mmetsp:Transcript_59203/g.157597  ORF Transcript_59203/g.157597 Transcript_59203/m.157597 type:complete len:83 (+) Transcript_59203:70-318(+)
MGKIQVAPLIAPISEQIERFLADAPESEDDGQPSAHSKLSSEKKLGQQESPRRVKKKLKKRRHQTEPSPNKSSKSKRRGEGD